MHQDVDLAEVVSGFFGHRLDLFVAGDIAFFDKFHAQLSRRVAGRVFQALHLHN